MQIKPNHSLRITPAFIEEEKYKSPTYFLSTILKVRPDFYSHSTIIVEEDGEQNNQRHYHILFQSELKQSTIRSRIKKIKHTNTKYYCLKKQATDSESLDKSFRYHYKAKDEKTNPKIIASPHSEKEIEIFQKRYYEIHNLLIQNKSLTIPEKTYQYLKITKGTDLPKMSRREIAVEITFNRVQKGKPPYMHHQLVQLLDYIEFQIATDIQGEDLRKTIQDYFQDL